MDDERWRTFVALPLSDEVHAALGRLQRRLRRRLPDGVRWVRPEGIHLTLFFLGEIPPVQIEPISAALTAVARHVPPFTLRVGGLGTFPSPHRPRVLWIGVDGGETLPLLHRAVNEALASLGHPPETRPFHPHLTLGRVRRGLRRDELAVLGEAFRVEMVHPPDLGSTPAEAVILFRSFLKPGGAEYRPLRRFPLRG